MIPDSLLVRLAREAAGLRCKDLGKLCQLAPASISCIETSEFRPAAATRWRLLRALLRELCVQRGIELRESPGSEREMKYALLRLIAETRLVEAELAVANALATD